MRRANLCNKMEHMRHKLHNTLVTVNAPLHPPLKRSLLSLEYRQTWRIIFGEILLRMRYTRLEFLDLHDLSLSLSLSLSRLKHDALPVPTALTSLVY